MGDSQQVWLVNAFSLNMLRKKAEGSLVFRKLSLEQARRAARGAKSAVGHASTAAVFAHLLGRPVEVRRHNVELDAETRLVVGQYVGPRLEEGVVELPEGATIHWFDVHLFKRRPDIHPRYSEGTFLDELASKQAPQQLEVLVAVPTNDSVLEAALVLKPRKLLLVDTGGPTRRVWQAILDWFAQRPGHGIHVDQLPDPEDKIYDEQLVRFVEDGLGKTPRDRVGFLVTTGTSVHASYLTQLAHASGAHVIHLAIDYDGDGQPLLDSARRLVHLELPTTTREIYALRQARALLRGGSSREAARYLDASLPTSPRSTLAQATLHWIRACEAREALRFEDAQRELASVHQVWQNELPAQRKRKVWVALKRCLDQTRPLMTPLINKERLHIAAEILAHARRESALGRYNHAALLYYRTAEIAVSHRLLTEHQIDVDDGVDSVWLRSYDGVVSDFESLTGSLAKGKGWAFPESRPITLLNGLVLLSALADPLFSGVRDKYPDDASFLRDFMQASRVRNKNLLAHGFSSISKGELDAYSALVIGGERYQGGVLQLLAGAKPRQWGRTVAAHSFIHLDDTGARAERQ